MQRIAAVSVLFLSCFSATTEAPLEVQVVDPVEVELPEIEEKLALPQPTEPAPATVSVAEMQRERAAYRDPRYVRRCGTESRRDTPVAERVEDRDEARARARALARSGELDTVLIFARVLYGETGTPNPRHNDDPRTPLWDEAEAILAVIDQRRGRMSRVEMMVNYSPRRVFPETDDERQQWIAELELDGTRPASWPRARQLRHHEYPPWRQYGCPRWLASVDAARRVIRAHPDRIGAGPCKEVPDHWGGTMDRYGFERGWRRVQCARGFTRNLFWIVPSREDRAEERAEIVLPLSIADS